jgi:outer membrane protein TolC
VQAKVMPDSISISELSVNDSLSSYWNSFTENHPILSINDLKQEQLRIQQKLAYQQLLPDISLGGYKINRAANSILSTQDLNSNYQFNIGLDVPLRLSKGRAEVSINKNQLLQTQLKRDYDQRKIENQVLYQLNEINIAKSQISLYDQYLGNISKLYRAENIKYTLGSSTIFLINSRENKLLDIRLKRLENLIKYQNAILKLYKEVARMEEL